MKVSTDRAFFHKASWAITEHLASRNTHKFYRDIPRSEVQYLNYNYETEEEVDFIDADLIQEMQLDGITLHQIKTDKGNLWFVFKSEIENSEEE